MSKPHIEITEEQGQQVLRGAKHCELFKAGWNYTENDNGTEGFYSYPQGFDCSNLCLDDAYKLHKMIEAWGSNDSQRLSEGVRDE